MMKTGRSSHLLSTQSRHTGTKVVRHSNPLKFVYVSVYRCWTSKKRDMLTYITQLPLSLSASHVPYSGHMHTQTHTRVHYYTITVQQEGNRFRLRAQGEVGTLTVLCVQWGGLGINTPLQSQVQQCPSMRIHSKIPISSTEAADAKYDDIISGISVVTGPEEEFRKQTRSLFFFFNTL